MPKFISIVYTGGTVGMETTEQGLQPSGIDRFSELFHSLPELNDDRLPKFELRASMPILDSARMKPRDWIRLATEVADNYDDYDGFLFIVGTDTMDYTASALSFFLDNIRKPVIITGAQYPLTDANSDAPANLIGAMTALEQAEGLFEVAIFFNGKVIRGNRSVKISSTEVDGIVSPNFPAIGQLDDGILNLRKDLILPEPVEDFRLSGVSEELPQISYLRICPGLDPDILVCALKEPVKGLILETYGSGTVADDPEFLAPLESASSRGVVIVNTSKCLRGRVDMKRYRTGYAMRNAGIVGGGDMTTAAAHTKLMYLLACGNSASKVRENIFVNLRGELTPERDDKAGS
jgi:L-asparaginase